MAGAADFEPGGVGGEQRRAGDVSLRGYAGNPCSLLPTLTRRLALARLLLTRCSLPPLAIRRFVGTGIAFLPVRYGPVTEPRRLPTCSGEPSATICPPLTTGGGAEIEQLVGAGDHLAIVLDQEQGVAQVAKFLQGVQEPGVVAGVQADRRFVEHVEHAAQAAAHLRGQADALHFSAGKRGGRPGEREVVEPHVDQELRAIADLAVDLARDLALAGRRLPGEEVGQHLAQRLAADLIDRAVAETHGGSVVAQAAAAADRAIDFVHQVFQAAAETGGNTAGFFQGRVETFELEAERVRHAGGRIL